MKERDMNIDALKGIAIILVVVGHCIQFIYSPDYYMTNKVYNIIYSFHMPLFMFISGYLSFSEKKSIDMIWLKRRFCSLMIPYLVWVLLSYFIKGAEDENIFIWLLESVLYVTNGARWFLLILFLNCVILFVDIQIQKKIPTDLVLLISFLVVNIGSIVSHMIFSQYYFGINMLAWQSTFFLGGYWINKRQILEQINKLWNWIIFIMLMALGWMWRIGGKPYFYQDVVTYLKSSKVLLILFQIGSQLYKYVIPFLWIYILFWLVGRWKSNILKRVISYVGLYTIEIYILHEYYFTLSPTINTGLNSLIFCVLGVLSPILLSILLGRVKFVKQILFGKS